MVPISITDARAQLPSLIDAVVEGAEIVLTRHGKPVAVIVRPEALRSRRATAAQQLADDLAQRLDRARRHPRRGPTISADRADGLVAEVRRGRSR